jgi:uncharacterized protein YbaR (Trm112 family)
MPDSIPNETPPVVGLDPAFLALLCCPDCDERPPLRLVAEGEAALVCDRCGRVYPFTEGYPDLRPKDGMSDVLAPAAVPDGGAR